MFYVVSAVATMFLAWFLMGVFAKLAYAAKVERELRTKQILPSQIENVVGRSKYSNALFFLKKKQVSPGDAAGLLDFYVLKGFGEHGTHANIDPDETKLLKILGYLQ